MPLRDENLENSFATIISMSFMSKRAAEQKVRTKLRDSVNAMRDIRKSIQKPAHELRAAKTTLHNALRTVVHRSISTQNPRYRRKCVVFCRLMNSKRTRRCCRSR